MANESPGRSFVKGMAKGVRESVPDPTGSRLIAQGARSAVRLARSESGRKAGRFVTESLVPPVYQRAKGLYRAYQSRRGKNGRQ